LYSLTYGECAAEARYVCELRPAELGMLQPRTHAHHPLTLTVSHAQDVLSHIPRFIFLQIFLNKV
jgi:hypothetical protein